MSSVEIKSIDSDRVRRAADAWAGTLLREHPEVDEIIVFGSFAKGTYAPGSDLDVVIVLAQADKPFRDRIPDYLPDTFPVGLDLFPITQREIASSVASGFLREVCQSPWRYLRPGRSSMLPNEV